MKAAVFYFLFFLNSADSCLKINYAEPPACACKSLALDSSNMQTEIGSVAFYGNVSAYPVKAPIISIDDCSGTVFCEGDYSLVVFDTDKVTMFDKYSADGFCDPFTQTWNVDKDGSGSLTTYKTLRGLCVDYSPPKTTPKPEVNCMSCPTYIEDFFNPDYSKKSDISFRIVYIHEDLSELPPENGCRRMKVECSSTDSCESIEIIAYSHSTPLTGIELETTLNSASSIIKCGDDGQYYFNNSV
ncbi:unnamed protein product [Caenorhabditis brenneri]